MRIRIYAAAVVIFATAGLAVLALAARNEARRPSVEEQQRRLEHEAAVQAAVRRAFTELNEKIRDGSATPEDFARFDGLKSEEDALVAPRH